MQQKLKQQRVKKKLLITGGHLTPAIAVIERLDKNEWEIIFLGRKVAQEGTSQLAREMHEIPKMGAKLITIPAGKIPRHLHLKSIPAIIRIPIGFLFALWHIARLKPEVILSFGGYVAVPAALAGKILAVPTVTHEQTVKKGLANSIIERFADVIAVSWPESQMFFKRKVLLTGNPLREVILQGPGRRVPIQAENIPLLYITGGSQGAHFVNNVISKILPQLLRKYAIVHQCGYTKEGKDHRKLIKIRNSLPRELQNRYLVRDWFEADEVAWLLRNADLLISRAGANTITEIAYTGATALLIPLPIAGRGEQLANAKLLQSIGTAEILLQSKLTPLKLKAKIHKMLKNAARYKEKANKATALVNPKAAETIVGLIQRIYEKAKKKDI